MMRCFLVTLLLLAFTSTVEANEQIASTDKLIKKFDLTVFYSEFRLIPLEKLHKWTAPIVIDLWYFENEHRSFVKILADDLSRLINLPIIINKENPDVLGNMHVYYVDRDWLPHLFLKYGISQDKVENYTVPEVYGSRGVILCGGFLSRTGSDISQVLVVIPSDLRKEVTFHCLTEEITQSIGVAGDSDIIKDSFFVEDENASIDINQLCLNDKIIIRALYDKRLKAGMTRKEAMEKVKVIIPELVAAVKERGVEALYQR